MTWLYTLVFAGLLFSSHDNPVNTASDSNSNAQNAVYSVKGDETERFEQTYPLSPNGRVSVSNVNGSIIINAWDRNEVKLVAVKTADSKERLADVEIKIDAKPDYLSVETNYDNWKTRNGDRWRNGDKLQVDYELTVPRGAALNEIETVNGSVTVADFSNLTRISAVNGNVKATNLRGTANLSTVNGEVFADFDRLEAGSKISLDTVNGTVNLSIPSDSNATLRADSVNGAISNDFGLPVRKGKYVGRDLYGRLGSGEIQVKLSSVNGPLTIGRNKDGKTQSPATNLLQQKNKDDEDWDDDSDKDTDKDTDNDNSVMVDTARINKDVAKAVKQSQKEAAVTMRKAQKEMVKVEIPVIKIDTEALKKATEMINSVDIPARVEAGVRAQVDLSRMMGDINFSGMPRIDKKSDAIPVKGAPKVTIDAPGCSVRVRGWDKQEVQYNVIQITDSRNRTPIQTNENHTDSTVNIKVVSPYKDTPPFLGDSPNRVRIEVFVPKKSDLKITTNGEIRLEGVSGEIDLSGDQESIDVRDVDGKMHVSTACGQVRVIGFRGELDAKTTEGNVYLEGDFDKLAAHAADGTVVLTLPANTNASIVSNTEIESEGVDLVQEKDSVWRLGTGGRKYNFDFGEGHLIVRNSSEISSY
jgi:DUF4097 and DUF4098 domain-containing protein YvlB